MARVVNRTEPHPPSRDVRHHLASGGDGSRSGICLSLCQALGTDLKDSLPARLAAGQKLAPLGELRLDLALR